MNLPDCDDFVDVVLREVLGVGEVWMANDYSRCAKHVFGSWACYQRSGTEKAEDGVTDIALFEHEGLLPEDDFDQVKKWVAGDDSVAPLPVEFRER